MKIGVYGLGRFGSFWAETLAKAGHEVVGYSRSKRAVPKGVTIVSEEEVLSSSYLVFCVAISSFESVLRKCASHIPSDTLVMDTCSVKVYPAKWMNEILGERVHHIATHPMFGPDSGQKGVVGLPFVMCNLNANADEYNTIKDAMQEMQLKVLEMTPDAHDREAAWSQGIVHFMGRVLDELALQPTELGTKGYKSLMTIVEQTCNDPKQLFYDLQRYNPYTKQMRLGLKGALDYEMAELIAHEV